MKKIIIYTALFVFTGTLFSQQTIPDQPLSSQEYLKISKEQKSNAWIFLGIGAAFMGTGLLIGARKESTFDDAAAGALLGGAGALMSIISIPLFAASSKNKKRGLEAVTYIKLDEIPLQPDYNSAPRVIPTASIKVRF